MTDDKFLTQFERATLNRAAWTHEAHVRMAWLYVARTDSYRTARAKVRSGIRKLNAAFLAQQHVPCGATRPAEPVAAAEDKPTTGFHETITTAFVRLVAARAKAGEKFGADQVSSYEYSLGGNGKSSILGTTGSIKVVRVKDGPVVGVHMIGGRVGELIGEGQLIVNWEAHPEDITPLVHAHPTQNEALGEAFLALAGKPLHAM